MEEAPLSGVNEWGISPPKKTEGSCLKGLRCTLEGVLVHKSCNDEPGKYIRGNFANPAIEGRPKSGQRIRPKKCYRSRYLLMSGSVPTIPLLPLFFLELTAKRDEWEARKWVSSLAGFEVTPLWAD